jgi:hypothetical protein
MYPTPTLTLTHIIIYRRITDGRIKRSGAQCNFYIYYDFDGEEVATALSLDEYNGEGQYAWVLLAAI